MTEKVQKNLHISKKSKYLCTRFWKDGRVVYCVGLENRSTETYRGFESLSFRKTLLGFVWPSLLELANNYKGLHRMPVADSGDSGELRSKAASEARE